MSLFSNLGEKVERFKQKAVDASQEQAEFACRACEEPVYTDQETCPHCGADAVVRIRDGDEGTDSARDGEDRPRADDPEPTDERADTGADEPEPAGEDHDTDADR